MTCVLLRALFYACSVTIVLLGPMCVCEWLMLSDSCEPMYAHVATLVLLVAGGARCSFVPDEVSGSHRDLSDDGPCGCVARWSLCAGWFSFCSGLGVVRGCALSLVSSGHWLYVRLS